MAARPDDADEPVVEPVGDSPRNATPSNAPDPPSENAGVSPEEVPQDGEPPTPAAPVPGSAERNPAEVDAQWADIVARLSDVELAGDAEAGPGRAAHDPTEPDSRRQTDVANPDPDRMVRPARSVDDPRSWQPDAELEEAENHFEPPDPGPMLGGDPLVTMAWGAVVGIPVLLIVAVVLWRDLPTLLLAAAGALLLGGVGLLLWRMPHSGDDDRTGPGAVV